MALLQSSRWAQSMGTITSSGALADLLHLCLCEVFQEGTKKTHVVFRFPVLVME